MPAASAVAPRAYEWGEDWQRTPTGLLVPEVAPRFDGPIGIGLFVGAGGFDLGMHEAGFHVVAANEFDPHAALTYLTNLARYGQVDIRFVTDEDEQRFQKALDPKGKFQKALDAGTVTPTMAAEFTKVGQGWISGQPPAERGCELFWFGDCTRLSGSDFLEPLGLAVGEVDVVFGGPPCQGFSVSGERNVEDPRNSLVFQFMRLVTEIKPKAFIMENVPGMLSMITPEGIPVVDALANVAESGGFATYDAVRNALTAQSGGLAAMRNSGKKMTKKSLREDDEPDEADDFEQLGMAV